jgi:hypothetical protein
MSNYELRYKGARWDVLYGSRDGVERFALTELLRGVQDYLPYVVRVAPAGDGSGAADRHLILIGTAANNRQVAELVERRLVSLPDKPQSYALACIDSPWCAGRRVIAVAGRDARGVLYAAEDFNARILAAVVNCDNPTPERLREAFDNLKGFNISEFPRVENRGIWTWGYVIYDYRRFIDNMAKLRMNTLIVWNDCPPLNCREVIEHAHSRGVRIILGFHWGWGKDELDLANSEHRRLIKDDVLERYKRDYRQLGMDGIYFQTLTEHNVTETGKRSTASLACEMVNDVAAALYEIDPGLYIQFGLHATSIRERYTDLKPLDPRVTIVWEDAGVLPYSGFPRITGPEGGWLNSQEETLAYSKKLATFREKAEFALVPKGWINLRWHEDFEHHGPFILGERDAAFICRRLEQRRPYWDRVNTRWLELYPHAAEFYRQMLDCRPPEMTAAALVEDGLFEAEIPISVALFAETIWNPCRTDAEMLQLATSPYYGNTR